MHPLLTNELMQFAGTMELSSIPNIFQYSWNATSKLVGLSPPLRVGGGSRTDKQGSVKSEKSETRP